MMRGKDQEQVLGWMGHLMMAQSERVRLEEQMRLEREVLLGS